MDAIVSWSRDLSGARMSSEADAFLFNLELRRLQKPDACAALFREAIARYEFDTFACGELDMRDRDRCVFYLIGWPDAWRRFYVGSGLVHRDPLLDALATRQDPFTWSDLRAERLLPKVGRSALELAAAEGWTEGLVVPMRQSGNRVGLVSMAGRQAGLSDKAHAYLCLISICLHSHVRTLVAREGFAAPPAGLTEREMDALRLVAKGMSDAAIGRELGVARDTAHEFVEKAKRRLKARSRAELATVAAALGIIDI